MRCASGRRCPCANRDDDCTPGGHADGFRDAIARDRALSQPLARVFDRDTAALAPVLMLFGRDATKPHAGGRGLRPRQHA